MHYCHAIPSTFTMFRAARNGIFLQPSWKKRIHATRTTAHTVQPINETRISRHG